jgi:hypothetical protein
VVAADGRQSRATGGWAVEDLRRGNRTSWSRRVTRYAPGGGDHASRGAGPRGGARRGPDRGCRDALTRGGTATFLREATISAELWEFGVYADLLEEAETGSVR